MGKVYVSFEFTPQDHLDYIRDQVTWGVHQSANGQASKDIIETVMDNLKSTFDGTMEAQIAQDMASEISTAGDAVIVQHKHNR